MSLFLTYTVSRIEQKKTKKKTNRKTSHSIIIIIMASKRENALLKHANPKTIKEYHSGSDIMAI